MTDIKHYVTTEDVFRKQYHGVTEQGMHLIDQIKSEAETLWSSLNWHSANFKNGAREISIAKTKMEEAVMWAIKGICTPPLKAE